MKEKGMALHLKALVLTLVAALLIFIPVIAVPQNAEAATKTISSGEMIQTSSGGVSATKNTTNSTVAVTITPKYYQSEARAQLAVLNKWRASNPGYKNQNEKWVYNGAQKALKYDYTLEKYAMQRAAEIAISMDHLRPSGTKRSGLTGYRGIGENIAATTYAAGGTKEYAFEMFEEKNKPYEGQGHRRIMISEPADFDAVGIACVYYNGSYYWAQIFGETTKPVTNPTEAVNGNKTMTVEVNPSLIKSKTADISKLSDMKMDMHKLSQDYLPEIPLSLGFNSTWPYATVNVIAKPTWTSGNTNIATVDSSKGTIKAVMNGSTSLTVKEPITGTSKTIKLTVTDPNSTDPNSVEEVKLNKNSFTLAKNKTEKLIATVSPSNAKNNKVTWSSSNTNVATVSSDGTVKGIKRGQATITAKISNGKSATCKVQVLFDDVQDSTVWYYKPIYWALNNGVTNGSTGNKFSPNDIATREQAVTLLYNYVGKLKVGTTTALKDISQCSSWAVNPVKWAKERKLTTRDDNNFMPKAECDRAAMVVFLWRLAGSPNPTISNPFSDVKQNTYYYKAVLWAKEKKVTSATGKFNPTGKLRRSEAVTFLYNYNNRVGKK